MAALDLVTMLNAAIAATTLALRANMLKPEARAWASSRPASLIIMGLSVTLGGYAIDVFNKGGASAREAALVTVLAMTSTLMLVHLWRQRRAPAA